MANRYPIPLLQWLELKVKELIANPTGQCVEWPYARHHFGYGRVSTSPGETNVVHREAFRFAHGRYPVPYAMHTCDNPPCFNPAHLVEGTAQDNNNDKTQKGHSHGGRMPGEQHPMVILTETQVREIRSSYVFRKVTYEALGKRYGVAMGTIFDIVNRRSWNHLTD